MSGAASIGGGGAIGTLAFARGLEGDDRTNEKFGDWFPLMFSSEPNTRPRTALDSAALDRTEGALLESTPTLGLRILPSSEVWSSEGLEAFPVFSTANRDNSAPN